MSAPDVRTPTARSANAGHMTADDADYRRPLESAQDCYCLFFTEEELGVPA